MKYRKIAAGNTNHCVVANLGLFPTNFFLTQSQQSSKQMDLWVTKLFPKIFNMIFFMLFDKSLGF